MSGPQTGSVTIEIHDIPGEETATLINEQKNLDRCTVRIGASAFATGIHICRLRVNI